MIRGQLMMEQEMIKENLEHFTIRVDESKLYYQWCYYCKGRCDDVKRSCKALFQGVQDWQNFRAKIPAIESSKLSPRIG